MLIPLSAPVPRPAGRGWRITLPLVPALALLIFLVSAPQTALAHEESCTHLDPETIMEQMQSRGFAFTCIPDPWNLYVAEDDAWLHPLSSLSLSRRIQQEVFASQFVAGSLDDFVIGTAPEWAGQAEMRWHHDFAAVGYPSATDSAVPIFLLIMWAEEGVDLDRYAEALAARAFQYETLELPALWIRYLDGETEPAPQRAYVLNGPQMQELFHLDSGFLNNRYVIFEPTETSRSLNGIPIFTFFSSTPIELSDMHAMLDSLLFRPSLPPTEPDPDLIVRIDAPLGLLDLVPSLQTAAQALVAEWTARIQDEAVDFARTMPYNHLLPFQLLTADTNLYWAPWDMHTGRLMLWHYTGGAHGNTVTASWTFTDTGEPVALTDILMVEPADALARITEAAIQHRRAQEEADVSTADIADWVQSGLTDLEAISAWNPVMRQGRTWLMVTLDPYVIAPYAAGIQEFLVEMPLKAPE